MILTSYTNQSLLTKPKNHMKASRNLFYLSAIALIGAAGMTACTSEDDVNVAETSPTYDSRTGEVATQFVLSFATGNEVTTRMGEANTQATATTPFRGINEAYLMAYKLGVANDGKNVSEPITADKLYNVGTILAAGAIDPSGGGTAAPLSRRVIELALPTETNALMFWGKAIKNGTSNQQGAIDWVVDKNIANNTFTMKRRLPAGDTPNGETAFRQYEKLIAAVLTKIVQTSVDYDVTYGGVNKTGTLKWSDYIEIDAGKLKPRTDSPVTPDIAMCALGEILADAFVQMNTIYPNELRAGSGPTVAKMLGDLYTVVHNVAIATPSTIEEAVTKAVAQGLQTNIGSVINDPGANPQWITTIGSIKTFSGVAASEVAMVTGDLNDFPTSFDMPLGSTTLNYDVNTNTYNYNDLIPTYSMSGTPGGWFNIMNYRYPAELCYFGNSPIRVSDDSHLTKDYPDGVTNWDDDASWAAGATGAGSKAWTKNGHVLSSTRSVAMQENINYGTALLKTTVRYGSPVLYDNNYAIQHARTGATEANAEITPSAGAFTLTGVLVGGQEETVGWNYLVKATEPKYESYVYDNDLPSTAIPAYSASGAKSVPNYTLVWDNWNPSCKGAKQNVVYIALEFVNNTGRDFWGMNNLIRKGATFYITGRLDPDEGLSLTDHSEGITWPTHYALPPYDSNGNTIKERRIFIQDFMTEANFVIGASSLQYALVAVPDLRSTQISLGLSVDLNWQTGLSFEEVVLGN